MPRPLPAGLRCPACCCCPLSLCALRASTARTNIVCWILLPLLNDDLTSTPHLVLLPHAAPPRPRPRPRPAHARRPRMSAQEAAVFTQRPNALAAAGACLSDVRRSTSEPAHPLCRRKNGSPSLGLPNPAEHEMSGLLPCLAVGLSRCLAVSLLCLPCRVCIELAGMRMVACGGLPNGSDKVMLDCTPVACLLLPVRVQFALPNARRPDKPSQRRSYQFAHPIGRRPISAIVKSTRL